MSKSRFNIYIKSDIKERFSREFDNASKEIQQYMRRRLEATTGIEGRIRELESELEEERQALQELKNKHTEQENLVQRLEDELRILEEEQKTREENTQEAMPKFLEIAEQKLSGYGQGSKSVALDGASTWNGPSDVPEYWCNEMEKSKEQLWQVVEDRLISSEDAGSEGQ
jgi:hypothetical protein